ncbi:Flp pilus assembly complex ATPase component TadA [Candidatus Uhrbacteria bacterium]|nr:Flp pilus assembly complex ATPase component TadA [Candidatus Uhrbacteria bacterium]
MLPIPLLKTLIAKHDLVPLAQLKNVEKEAAEAGLSLEEALIKNKVVYEEDLYRMAAEEWQVPFVRLIDRAISRRLLESIPENIATQHEVVAFDKKGSKLALATLNPESLEFLEFINPQNRLDIEIHLTTPSSIRYALKIYHQDILQENPDDSPTVKIVQSLLENAIAESASDVHIEPGKNELAMRYRIDGLLQPVMVLPKSQEEMIVSRIKLLAGLKMDEHRAPQDGRFNILAGGSNVSIRVSVIPTINGEKIVLRILNPKTENLSLEELGFGADQLKTLKAQIGKRKGLILVTGPGGSGKTTTLYSILKTLNNHEVNITTIEDPIEYTLQGVNQSQVNAKAGYTFAAALRSFLRQDPNIIMVGEIRDQETAEVAFHAASTGHLVFSTLHATDSAGVVPRLLQMGVAPFLIGSTVNLIINQRLVRKICVNCKESYQLSKEGLEDLSKNLNIGNLGRKSSGVFYRGRGCQACGQDGYKGRTGIYEVLELKPDLAALISKKLPPEELEHEIKSRVTTSLAQAGFLKAAEGVTTLSEVARVVKEN